MTNLIPTVWTQNNTKECHDALSSLKRQTGHLVAQQLAHALRELIELSERFTGVSAEFNPSDRYKLFIRIFATDDEGVAMDFPLYAIPFDDDVLTTSQWDIIARIEQTIEDVASDDRWWYSAVRDVLVDVLSQPRFITLENWDGFHRSLAGPDVYDAWAAGQNAVALDCEMPSPQKSSPRARV